MIRLCLNYYRDKKPERQAELDQCLIYNLNNAEIDRIVAIADVDGARRLPTHPKIDWILHNGRPTFNDIFRATKLAGATGDDLTIVANSDIYFDHNSVYFMNHKLHHHEAYAMTRWDVKADGSTAICAVENISGLSQDAWAFRGEIRDIKADFPPGILGCDNRLAQLMIEAGYTVFNPSRVVKPYHIHHSNIRNYDTTNMVTGMYAEVPVSNGDIPGYTIGAPVHRSHTNFSMPSSTILNT